MTRERCLLRDNVARKFVHGEERRKTVFVARRILERPFCLLLRSLSRVIKHLRKSASSPLVAVRRYYALPLRRRNVLSYLYIYLNINKVETCQR